MTHTFLPVHDGDLLRAAAGAGLLDQVDQVYACQRLCFSPTPNRCQCARCRGLQGGKQVGTCDPACANLPSCDKPSDNRIYGVTATETFAYCGSSKMLCDTMADCTAAPPVGPCSDPTSCKNFSLNCDPTCQ